MPKLVNVRTKERVRVDRVVFKLRTKCNRVFQEAFKQMFEDMKLDLMAEAPVRQWSNYRHGTLGEPHFWETLKYYTWHRGRSFSGVIYSTHPRANYIIGMFTYGRRRGYPAEQSPVFVEPKRGEVTKRPLVRGKYGDLGLYTKQVSDASVKPVIGRIIRKYKTKLHKYIKEHWWLV